MRLCFPLLVLVLDEGFSDEMSAMRGEDVLGHSEEVVAAGEKYRRLLSVRSQEEPSRRLGKKKEECRKFDQSEIQSRGPQLITIEVEKAHDLPKMSGSWGGTDVPDAYVVYNLEVGGEKYFARTDVIKNKRDPDWDFKCQYPVPESISEVTIDAEVWDDNSGRKDVRIGTFKKKVKYKQKLSGSGGDGELVLRDCSKCTKDAVVVLKTSWGTSTSPGGKQTNKGKGGFPWFWVILGSLLVLALVGGAAAYVMFAGSGTEVQKTPARNALVGAEMQGGHWQHQPPPQQQYYSQPPQPYQQQQPHMWPPPPPPSVPGGGGGLITVEVGVSGPRGYQCTARDVARF